jgi:hypothetical protein
MWILGVFKKSPAIPGDFYDQRTLFFAWYFSFGRSFRTNNIMMIFNGL